MGQKIVFLHSKSYFALELRPNIVFRHSNPILTFKIGPNIVYWHSKSYFNIQTGADYRTLTFKSYFDIQTEAKYRILAFKIVFWQSKLGRNPILIFKMGPIIVFLTFETRPKIEFWHSKSYFDIRNGALYRILTWHWKWGRISYFDIQNSILTFELRPNIVFWHSKSYCDIRTGAEYRILTFKMLFWRSNWGRLSYFDIQNPIYAPNFGKVERGISLSPCPSVCAFMCASVTKFIQIQFWNFIHGLLTKK